MRQQRVAFGHLHLPEEESDEQHEGNDEWRDEDCRVPAFDWGLSEAENEEHESSEEDNDTSEIHPFDLFPAWKGLRDGFSLGDDIPRDNGKGENEHGGEAEVP